MSVAHVVERLFTDAARGIFRGRRARVVGRMLGSFPAFVRG
jgi:hypothetical protein